MQNDYVYADNNATTQMDPEVIDEMTRVSRDVFGNPSSPHRAGRKAAEVLNHVRQEIAGFINCRPDEIILTSGGTEANNLAVNGVMMHRYHENKNKMHHMVFSSMEHPAVKGMFFKNISNYGCSGTFMPVDDQGVLSISTLLSSLSSDTCLAAVMHANNETGVIEPVEEIGCVLNDTKIHFHVDAVQTLGKIDVNVKKINAHSLAGSAHKIYGPKGAGFLYIGADNNLRPLFFGGHQQKGIRPGTENTPAAAGMAKAIEICSRKIKKEILEIKGLRNEFEKGLSQILRPDIDYIILSSLSPRIGNTSNVCFKKQFSAELIKKLDGRGICCSAGSACANSRASKGTHSPVLDALAVPAEFIEGCLRFSFGRFNTLDDIRKILLALKDVLNNSDV
jgi:cysteine desulfurase